MACASFAGQTFTKQLYSLQLGLPQWHPESQTQAGDVGFFFGGVGGQFVKLHNILDSRDGQANGVPDGFEPLLLPSCMRWIRRHGERNAQPLTSLSVKKTMLSAGLSS